MGVIGGGRQRSILTWRISRQQKNLYESPTRLVEKLLAQFCLKTDSMHLWAQAIRNSILVRASEIHEEYGHKANL